MDATTVTSPEFVLERERPAFRDDVASQFLSAVRGSEKRHGAMLREIVKLAFGPGKLSPKEYFDYRLFDDACLDFPAKLRFAGLRAARRIWAICNTDPTYVAAVHDKLLFTALMRGLGLRAEPILAVYGGSGRTRDPLSLNDPADLRRFLADPARHPMVGKPVDGRQSLGVIGIDRYDAGTDTLVAASGRRVPFAQFARELESYRKAGYLFQRRLVPHPKLAHLHGPRIATVRMTTAFGPDGPEIMFVAFKIPAGDNLADNFWRPGNLLTSLDRATGRIEHAVRGVGVAQEVVNQHPDTGVPLQGFQLPFWAEVRQLCLDAASTLPRLRLLGWDIAVGTDGPLLLEANYRPALELHQYVAGGVLNEGFEAFLSFCADTSAKS